REKTCTLCRKRDHTIEGCWQPGGGMAGHREEVLMKICTNKLTHRGGSQLSSGHSTPHPVSAPSSLPPVHYDESRHAYILDSVTGVHISNTVSDFYSLCPIAPHVINGVSGSGICAVGTGNICLTISGGCHVTLEDISYIP
ncbi:hypothetical protein PAXRUDRAFT_72460, partial [Paxillus rubicundulus Ve08.2h10]